jgi:citrate synthase
MNDQRYLSATEAAEELGITLPTLYAYVSRGLVHSEAAPTGKRQRRYFRDDILRLTERKSLARDPRRAAETALQWGEPVLESEVTLIAGGRFYYRGHDAVELAKSHSFEEALRVIWRSDDEGLFDTSPPSVPLEAIGMLRAWKRLNPIERFEAILPMAQSEDAAAYVLSPDAVVRTGARIVRLLTWIAISDAVEESGDEFDVSDAANDGIAATLQFWWAPAQPQARELIDAALVLLADHELNVSSFTARCVASAGSTPYAVVLAGLAALQGYRHGGSAELVTEILSQAATPDAVPNFVVARLKRGETLPGFGHPLYPDGDPRCAALLDLLSDRYATSEELDVSLAFIHEMSELTSLSPNVDFVLATMCRVLGLPPAAAITLFAIGRTGGWIAQAVEQYNLGTLIRPRAKYTGVLPNEA